jgi:hypothetical protein
MPVSKQRKNQKKKSTSRTNKLKNEAKVITKKFLENYNKIIELEINLLNLKLLKNNDIP